MTKLTDQIMNKLTEQQKLDLFKDVPPGYNYYMPEGDDWEESWFAVVDGVATKGLGVVSGKESGYPFQLYLLTEGGAIKLPEPKKETNMIYTQEMHDNDVLPSVGMEVVARYNFDSKQVTHQGEVLYVSKHHVILNTIHGNEWHGLLDDFTMEPLPPVKKELEIAQEKQVIDVTNVVADNYFPGVGYTAIAKLLQEKGMLAKIILPVKG